MNGTPYLLVGLGDQRYAAEIGEAAQKLVDEKLRLPALSVADRLPLALDPAEAAPYVVVYVAFSSEESITEQDLRDIHRAVDSAVPVLPIGCGDASLSTLPAPLSQLNGRVWDDESQVLSDLLTLLGIVEQERRAFLSYKRSESEPIAFQLRYALQDRGFDVFLDRFSIPPAVDFQRRLDTELSDKAFVILLEGPTTGESEWVRHEISYALHHHVSLIAITAPEVSAAQEIKSIPEALRFRFNEDMVKDSVDGRVLTSAALDELLLNIEWEHALRLRRHRQQLVDTLSDWLRQSGHEVTISPGWTVIARSGNHDGVYLITPRAPTPEDLRRVDLARQDIDVKLPAIVAHNPELVEPAISEIITWITDRHEALHAEHHAGLRLLMRAD